MTDSELVKKILDGDTDSFRQLVELYQVKIRNTCMGFVHNKHDAEDVAQEVFIEVYRSISKFRGQSALSTWLYRIAVNKSLNHLRSKNRSIWGFGRILENNEKSTNKREEENKPDDSNPEIIIEEKENKKLLHQALKGLPQNQKIAFTLYRYEDLSYKEISEIMGISLANTESLIFRAKKGLMKKLFKK